MATMIARFVPSMKHRITSLLVLAALTCAFGAARAEKADRSKPMNIEADALRHDEVKQTSVFSGRVVMTKGSIVLRGARLARDVLHPLVGRSHLRLRQPHQAARTCAPWSRDDVATSRLSLETCERA